MSAFLEVGTMATCVLSCKYCPQALIKESYKSDDKKLSLENFKLAIDKLPPCSEISFAGFSEPCINPDCIDMVLYAHEQGHYLRFSTTLVGLTIEQYDRIKHIPYVYFSVHLPDNSGKTTVQITEQYKEILQHVINNPTNGTCKHHHHFGDLHNEIRDIVLQSDVSMIYDRAGNVEIADNMQSASDLSGEIECGYLFMFKFESGGALLLPNGDCVLCCSDFGLKHKLGNLFTQSWEEIVNSDEMKFIQEGLKDESKDILCRKCYLAKKV